jgi:ribosomal protein S5
MDIRIVAKMVQGGKAVKLKVMVVGVINPLGTD